MVDGDQVVVGDFPFFCGQQDHLGVAGSGQFETDVALVFVAGQQFVGDWDEVVEPVVQEALLFLLFGAEVDEAGVHEVEQVGCNHVEGLVQQFAPLVAADLGEEEVAVADGGRVALYVLDHQHGGSPSVQ